MSLPELRGHLADHVPLTHEDDVEFHWLFPVKNSAVDYEGLVMIRLACS